MALTLDYPDAYLAKFCTDDRETRAFAAVDLIATTKGITFSAGWRNELGRLKCYTIACTENQAAPDDLFSTKLKSYRAEFDAALALAESDAATTAGTTDSALIFAIPLERS
jgi:hypothetical protein